MLNFGVRFIRFAYIFRGSVKKDVSVIILG